MEDENKVGEEVSKDEQVVDQDAGKPDERPEANWKAELERKNREIERLRMEMVSRESQPKQRDPNDLKTWPDHELKAVLNNKEYLQYHEQVNDILLDRKLDARIARQAETTKRVSADLELKQKFPDALDPSSALSIKMDELVSKFDLSRTPAGRLVAAQLAANELNQGKATSVAQGRKKEQDRVASVKGQMVDGDRPKPTENKDVNLENKRKELADGLMDSKHEARQVDAVADILADRGFTRDKFFGKR